MHRQLRYLAIEGRRKRVVLPVLIFLVLLLGVSFHYSVERGPLPAAGFSNYRNIFTRAWIYPVIAATLLAAGLFFLLLTEIRVRKKIIEELNIQKEHYRIMVSSMAEGLITTGTAGEILYMNPAAEKLTGWRISEALRLPLEKVYDVVNESSGQSFENIASRVLRKKQLVKVENNTLLRTKNSHQVVISNSGAPLYDARGNLAGALLVFNAVAEKKKTDTCLNGSSITFNTLIEHLPEAVFTCDINGYIQLYNKAAAALWGRAPLRGTALWTGAWKTFNTGGAEILPGDCPTAIAIQQQRPVQAQEIIIQRSDNSFRHVLAHTSPLLDTTGQMTGAVTMLTDITERKKSETISAQAVERYEILLKATSDTIWDWDIVNNRMIYNSGITKMFGYQIAQVEDIFNWWKENIHPDDRQVVMDAYYGPIENTRETIQQEYRFRCADGSYKYIYDRAFILYAAQQQPTRIIGSMQDITYKKEEEKRFSKAIIDAQEQERRHIGEELHDNVNQLLASALLTLGMVKHSCEDQAKVTEYTDRVKEYTSTALNEIRKLSHDLAPATEHNHSLRNIFETLLNGINLKNQFTIYFHFDDRVHDSIGLDIQLNLYRILQEQVKNILAYAAANTISLEVLLTASGVKMITADNGKGFDVQLAKKGIGFSNMKRRVESFGGKLLFMAAPGLGCTITVEIPCGLPVAEANNPGPATS